MKNIFLLIFIFPLWIIYFLSRTIPRDKTLIAFGTHTKSFSGNIKSLFLKNDPSNYKKIFISNEKVLVDQLIDLGYHAYMKLSFKGIWYSLRSGTYIYSGFPSDISFWLSSGTKYINLWHGTPIKKIERDVTTGKFSLKNRYPWVFKFLKPDLVLKPDVLLISSNYEEKCFTSAFNVESMDMFRTFPPRLEGLMHNKTEDTDNYTNILYTPTWRDDHSFSFANYVVLDSFNDFLVKNQIKFYIKLHPSDTSMQINEKFSNIISIGQSKDVYDFLEKTHILVSDYSSMVFEGLYLSKPVILFCPDYKNYQENSREFYIDPCEELPVMVSYTQQELEDNLLISINNTKIDHKKFDSFKPYPIEDKILEKLVDKAHLGI